VTVRLGVLVGYLLRFAFAGIVAVSGVEARAAGIFRDLTPLDRSQPILLSQAGDVISLRSPGHPAAGLVSSVPPAYLAFSLHGGEKIPARTPSVTTGQAPGVGPLDLNPSIQPTLNADLIERAEATPDTVLTLVDGTKFVVEESIDELIERMRMHRAAVLAYASEIERGTGQPPQGGPRLRVIPGSEERS